jgi:tellurite resistance protein TerC
VITPIWAWAGALAGFAVLIAADLRFTKSAAGGLRSSALLSALWIAAAVAFGGVLWLWQGAALAGQYYAGYVLEKALSVDNILVFVLLLSSLRVPVPLQRRVLHYGVIGALVLRGGLIAAGGALIGHVGWIFYVFGALVLLAGLRMFRPTAGHPQENVVARLLRRGLPVTAEGASDRFVVRDGARIAATPLLVALVAVEVTDLVFALDSIPAVFGVTSNLFVVFTSNAFAVLGLRALYFVLAGSVDRFVLLKPGIALLLIFIGVKMLIAPVVELPVTASLAVIAVVAAGAVGGSLWRERARPSRADPRREPAGRKPAGQ